MTGEEIAKQKLTARVVPYSSVVGSSVSLIARDGSHFAQLGVMGVDTRIPSDKLKETHEEIARKTAVSFNAYDAFGLALMMIREGVADPKALAAKTLAKVATP